VSYWQLVEPVWDTVSIYDGAEVFLHQYNAAPEASRILFAAHWCQSEINNGGFEQFFSNSTGVLAPEGARAFRALHMPLTAELIVKAMAAFGPRYPRERTERDLAMDEIGANSDDQAGPFHHLDEEFFVLVETENGGFRSAANAYAVSMAL